MSDGWLTVEVFDGPFPGHQWWRAHSAGLIEAAITNRARNWYMHEHRWGFVVEFEFATDEDAEAFRQLPAIQAALDAVPDKSAGLLVYRGRGGGSGSRVPRGPRPIRTSDAAARPIPEEHRTLRLELIGC
ncbi:hypothetical protein [Smaragdicoccus niigatensis]|uniref:hypothetical protein n=1 Tax=Smaragdicoccus niigatensis TaxID=359359 RepID=UPI00036ECF7C|nr:hypothetical protein [Smaragdicoccus niigatensis]